MNHTIYFRKPVWEKFELEEKKSELINHLLERHYESVLEGSFRDSPKETSYYVKAKSGKNICKQHQVDKSVCAMMKHK